jgi:hypothetical protein
LDQNGNPIDTGFGDMDAAQTEDIYYLDGKLCKGEGGYVEFVSNLVNFDVTDGWRYHNLYNTINSISSYSIY